MRINTDQCTEDGAPWSTSALGAGTSAPAWRDASCDAPCDAPFDAPCDAPVTMPGQPSPASPPPSLCPPCQWTWQLLALVQRVCRFCSWTVGPCCVLISRCTSEAHLLLPRLLLRLRCLRRLVLREALLTSPSCVPCCVCPVPDAHVCAHAKTKPSQTPASRSTASCVGFQYRFLWTKR